MNKYCYHSSKLECINHALPLFIKYKWKHRGILVTETKQLLACLERLEKSLIQYRIEHSNHDEISSGRMTVSILKGFGHKLK